MNYPDYVKEYRPKGTVVKKVGETYYVYYATSQRKPGKNYPVQVIKGLAGRIDRFGFHEQTRMVLDTKTVKVRECGFTNYMLMFEDEYVTHGMGNEKVTQKNKKDIYHSLIVYLSNNSYLGDEGRIYSTKELSEQLGIGIPHQLTMISKIVERPLAELDPLKYICSVEIDGKRFESELSPAQREIMERLGINEGDIRRRVQ